MASSSSVGSNSPQTDSTSFASDFSNDINAPPPSPEMVTPPPFLPFPIFPLPPLVCLSQEFQPWEGSEGDKGEDFKELWLKAKEDAEDEAHNMLMRAFPRRKIRRIASQMDSDSSTSTSSMFDFDSEES